MKPTRAAVRTGQVTSHRQMALATTGERFAQVGDISLCYEAIDQPDTDHTLS